MSCARAVSFISVKYLSFLNLCHAILSHEVIRVLDKRSFIVEIYVVVVASFHPSFFFPPFGERMSRHEKDLFLPFVFILVLIPGGS